MTNKKRLKVYTFTDEGAVYEVGEVNKAAKAIANQYGISGAGQEDKTSLLDIMDRHGEKVLIVLFSPNSSSANTAHKETYNGRENELVSRGGIYLPSELDFTLPKSALDRPSYFTSTSERLSATIIGSNPMSASDVLARLANMLGGTSDSRSFRIHTYHNKFQAMVDKLLYFMPWVMPIGEYMKLQGLYNYYTNSTADEVCLVGANDHSSRRIRHSIIGPTTTNRKLGTTIKLKDSRLVHALGAFLSIHGRVYVKTNKDHMSATRFVNDSLVQYSVMLGLKGGGSVVDMYKDIANSILFRRGSTRELKFAEALDNIKGKLTVISHRDHDTYLNNLKYIHTNCNGHLTSLDKLSFLSWGRLDNDYPAGDYYLGMHKASYKSRVGSFHIGEAQSNSIVHYMGSDSLDYLGICDEPEGYLNGSIVSNEYTVNRRMGAREMHSIIHLMNLMYWRG